MDHLHVYERLHLRDAALIVAFSGWNDASEVATYAARYLVEQWRARRVADFDPEEFYVFTESRPRVRIAGRFQRRVEWPANEFYLHTDPRGEQDLVVLIGTEPNLKWRTFADSIVDFCRQSGISTIVSLGGQVADVPHTFPVQLSGTASPSWLARRLRRLGVEATRYQGPTGILGVLSVACARRRLATASIWASVPEYLSASPNPVVSLTLLERLRALLQFDIDLGELEDLQTQFNNQVAEIMAEDEELRTYVQQLEEQQRAPQPEAEELARPAHEPLPSGEELIREVEEFLRRRRGQG